MILTTAEVAVHLQGEVLGDPTASLKGFAPADRAQAGDLTFAENEAFFLQAEQSAATAPPMSIGVPRRPIGFQPSRNHAPIPS